MKQAKLTHYPASFFYKRFTGTNQNSNRSMFFRMVIEKGIDYIEFPDGRRLYSLVDFNKKCSDKYKVEGEALAEDV